MDWEDILVLEWIVRKAEAEAEAGTDVKIERAFGG
jgi:hypothetical protein